MKAITLWEGWASAIRAHLKHIETRSWGTSYRGNLLIHASSAWGRTQRDAFQPLMRYFVDGFYPHLGMFVARATLDDCVQVVSVAGNAVNVNRGPADAGKLPLRMILHDREFEFGDIRPGRWLWILRDVKRTGLVPARGHQQLWDAPDDIPVLED